jgi:hypothetical protein
VANDFQGFELLLKNLQSDINELRKDFSAYRSLESRVARNEIEIQRIKDDKRGLWANVKSIENECAKRAVFFEKIANPNEDTSKIESYWHSVWYGATTHGIWILLSAGLSTVITLIITKGGGN